MKFYNYVNKEAYTGIESGGSWSAESEPSPEILEIIKLHELLERVQNLLSWLVEAGPGADPMVRAVRRGILSVLLAELGVDLEDPNAGQLIGELERTVVNKAAELNFDLELYSRTTG